MPADAIRQVLSANADAMVGPSAEKPTALLHADFVCVNARGMRFDKAGYIDTYCTSGKVVFVEQLVDDLSVREFPALQSQH